MARLNARRAWSYRCAQIWTHLRANDDANLAGGAFLLVATLLCLPVLLTPNFTRPGGWRLAFLAWAIYLAMQAIIAFGRKQRRLSSLGVLTSILVVDAGIVFTAACLDDRSGGRVVVTLFALPSLYLGLYAGYLMMIPQVIAVAVGAVMIMVMGGGFGPMAIIASGAIVLSVITPAFAVIVLRRRLVAALRRAKALSTTDPLTGLLNRRGIAEQAPLVVQLARSGGLALGVVVADVDHFKRINDRHGHAIGDEVLRLVAGAVRSCVRLSDVVVRLGGEEIAVLGALVPDDLADLAERIRQQVAVATEPWSVTVSLGVAWAEGDRLTGDPMQLTWALVDEADDLMYVAKRAGRNRVTLPPAPPLQLPTSG